MTDSSLPPSDVVAHLAREQDPVPLASVERERVGRERGCESGRERLPRLAAVHRAVVGRAGGEDEGLQDKSGSVTSSARSKSSLCAHEASVGGREGAATNDLGVVGVLEQHVRLAVGHAVDDLPVLALVARAPDVAAGLVVVEDDLRADDDEWGRKRWRERGRRRAGLARARLLWTLQSCRAGESNRAGPAALAVRDDALARPSCEPLLARCSTRPRSSSCCSAPCR